MDTSDLYDWEIQKISLIWMDLQRDWMKRPNTRQNLTQFAAVAHDEFLKAGFVVVVAWENTLMVNPTTMQPFPITIEVLGRIDSSEYDHERKQSEVIKANERGEKFLGQKGSKVVK